MQSSVDTWIDLSLQCLSRAAEMEKHLKEPGWFRKQEEAWSPGRQTVSLLRQVSMAPTWHLEYTPFTVLCRCIIAKHVVIREWNVYSRVYLYLCVFIFGFLKCSTPCSIKWEWNKQRKGFRGMNVPRAQMITALGVVKVGMWASLQRTHLW